MRRRRNEVAASDGSESSSLEDISGDDFRSRSRVWVGYPSVPRSFGQDLLSFAWTQAIQNKPLGFDVKPAKEEDEELVYEVDDEEQEEGELEEGEIELGSEPVTEANAINADASKSEKKEDDEEEDDVGIGEFDQRVGLILEELETITEEVTDLNFDGVCSRLQKTFANLKQMFSESAGVPVLDALVQQAFMGIQTVYGVYNSGNLKKEQNRELLLRLLIHIKNQYSVFLSAEQVKEVLCCF